MPETYTPASNAPPATWTLPNNGENASAETLKTNVLKKAADAALWLKDQITAILTGQKVNAVQAWATVSVDGMGTITVSDSYGMDAMNPVTWFNDRFEFKLASAMANANYALHLQVANGGSVDGRQFEEFLPFKSSTMCRAWLIDAAGAQVTGMTAPAVKFTLVIVGRRP